MSTTSQSLFAVCGGGNDTLALLVILAVVALYVALVRLPFVAATDGVERLLLAGVFVGSALLGVFVVLDASGILGGNYPGRFIVSMLAAAVVGFIVAQATRRVEAGRAVAVSLAGSVFLPGSWILVVFTSLGIGTGCLN